MITYLYPMKNIIKLRGEKWVRDSFNSLYGQSDDIIVLDYDSTQSEREALKILCDEYNFRFFEIPLTPPFFFHMSKMTNKAIIESKYPFYYRVTPDIIYPKNLTDYILNFYNDHNKHEECLVTQALKIGSSHLSPNIAHNKELLLKARGVDERTSYREGEHYYLRDLALIVFNLKPLYERDLNLKHRKHSLGPEGGKERARVRKLINWQQRIRLLRDNFDIEVKKVVNTYW